MFSRKMSALALTKRLATKDGKKKILPHTKMLRERLVLRGGHGESTQFCMDTPTCRVEVTRPAHPDVQGIGPQIPWTSRVEGWVERAWSGSMNASQINAALMEAKEGMTEVGILDDHELPIYVLIFFALV